MFSFSDYNDKILGIVFREIDGNESWEVHSLIKPGENCESSGVAWHSRRLSASPTTRVRLKRVCDRAGRGEAAIGSIESSPKGLI